MGGGMGMTGRARARPGTDKTSRGTVGSKAVGNELGDVVSLCKRAGSSLEKHCDLSSRRIVRLPDLVVYAPLLRSLDLSQNGIVNFPLALLHLENLLSLDLSDNRIQVIEPPPRTGVLWRLTSLCILRNNLEVVPHLGALMPSLSSLDLGGNSLSGTHGGGLCSVSSSVRSLGLGHGTIKLSENGQALVQAASSLSNIVKLGLDSHGLGEVPWIDAMDMIAGVYCDELHQNGGHGPVHTEERNDINVPSAGGTGNAGGGGDDQRLSAQRDTLFLVENAAKEVKIGDGHNQGTTRLEIGRQGNELAVQVTGKAEEGAKEEKETSERDAAERAAAESERVVNEEREKAAKRKRQAAELAKACMLPLLTVSSIASLDLSKNRLSSLPCALGGLMCLRCLDLSVNMFSCIPLGVFGLASSLEELSMSSNKITAWPDDVSQLGALSCLDVSWNRIENLPPSGIDSNGEWCDGQLVIMTHLTRLDISSNTLKDLRPALLSPSLTNICYKGNPLVQPPIEDLVIGFEATRNRIGCIAMEEKQAAEKLKREAEEREDIRREAENLRRVQAALADFKMMMDDMDEEEADD